MTGLRVCEAQPAGNLRESFGWQDQSRCIRPDAPEPDTFFPEHQRSSVIAAEYEAEAKAWCAGCPVREECLTDALRQEGWAGRTGRHGVRGGLTRDERYNLTRRNWRKAKK